MKDYCFVKISRGGSRPIWLFSPQSEEQVVEHFNVIFAREIADGVREHVRNGFIAAAGGRPENTATPWGKAVDAVVDNYHGVWILAANALENAVGNGRIKAFRDGEPILLADGVAETRLCGRDDIVETVFSDSLLYPPENEYTMYDVRFMRWNISLDGFGIRGDHWYAKVGNNDVCDSEGNMKWDTLDEAKAAARWFIDRINVKK